MAQCKCTNGVFNWAGVMFSRLFSHRRVTGIKDAIELCPFKLELSYSDPNGAFKVNEISKERFYSFQLTVSEDLNPGSWLG